MVNWVKYCDANICLLVLVQRLENSSASLEHLNDKLETNNLQLMVCYEFHVS